MKIAIDGPAGAGKSTIAKLLSKKLDILYLDTGAMYRAVAVGAMRKNIDITDTTSISKYLEKINIRVGFSNGEQEIFLNEENITWEIRNPEVSIAASNVAVIPEVRIKMVELQRKIAEDNSVIMDGRDIGTFVLPDADFKIFLNATIEERAKRRHLELIEKGIKDAKIEDVIKDIQYRDKNDSTRSFAPLKKANDAIELNTTNMSVGQVVSEILTLINNC